MARYKELVQQSFDALSKDVGSTDPLHAQIAKRLLELSQLRGGQSVLDIACGSGLVGLQAARLVGASGRVLALDASPGMVQQAQAAAAAARLTNMAVRHADAEDLDLPAAAFDAALCATALPYVGDAPAALRRWRAWLRPSGKLVLNAFKSPYDEECGLFYRLAERYGLPLYDPLAPLGSADKLRGVLQAAGYGSVAVQEAVLSTVVPVGSARDYAAAMWASSACDPHHHLQAAAEAAGSSSASAVPAAAMGPLRPPARGSTMPAAPAPGNVAGVPQPCTHARARQWDAAAVGEMEAAFLREAEAQVARRLRGGVVRTEVTVLYAVASTT